MDKVKVTIEIPPGYKLVQTGEGKWEQRKIKLPKTWEEFCEMTPIKDGECVVHVNSEIVSLQDGYDCRDRDANIDRTTLPDKKTAEAFIALMQLIQLRNCYNGDWVPDWTNYERDKYVIINENNRVKISANVATSHVLAFESESLATKFLDNFGYFIEIAKPLI